MVMSHRRESTDMETELHRIESEAYCAVLRALTARGVIAFRLHKISLRLCQDLIDTLLTLRKELRISESEHKNFIAKVESDDSVNMIRQWREGTVAEKGSHAIDIVPPHLVRSMSQASSKRLKTLHVPSVAQPASVPSISATHLNQCGNEAATISKRESIPRPKELISHSRHASVVSRGMAIQSKKSHQISDIHITKKRLATVEIRATNELINEVERLIYGGIYPNLVQVESAKLLLKEQESAIIGVLDKLAEFSDDEDSYPLYGKEPKNGHQLVTPYGLYEHNVDLAEGYYNNILNAGHTDGGMHTLCEPARYLETP